MRKGTLAIRTRSLSATGILALSSVCLVFSHLLLRNYMPNAAVGFVGFMLVAGVLYYVLFSRNDTFGFVLVVYVCSHFTFGMNQGGLFNLMSLVMLSALWLVRPSRERLSRRDWLMTSLIVVLVLWNCLGWLIKNPVPMLPRAMGAASFLGFIVMFLLVRNLEITRERVRLFFIVTFWLLLYQIIVSLNQRYMWVNWNTPLIGAYGEFIGKITYATTNAKGTLRHSELFGEYGTLLLALLIPMLSSSSTDRELRLSSNFIIATIFASLACIMLTSTRSAALLAVLVFIGYYVFLPMGIVKAVDRFGRQFKMVLIIGAAMSLIGAYIGLTTLTDDMAVLNQYEFTAGSVISGESLNRGGLFAAALQRMESESWFLGYGYGTWYGNRWAWLGVDPAKSSNVMSDYHSLYASLPMLYGWLGSITFVSIVFLTLYRTVLSALRNLNTKGFLIVLNVGFCVFWCVFLIDQYKTSILRNANYHMLFWIWLGISNALLQTIRLRNTKAPTRRRGTDRTRQRMFA